MGMLMALDRETWCALSSQVPGFWALPRTIPFFECLHLLSQWRSLSQWWHRLAPLLLGVALQETMLSSLGKWGERSSSPTRCTLALGDSDQDCCWCREASFQWSIQSRLLVLPKHKRLSSWYQIACWNSTTSLYNCVVRTVNQLASAVSITSMMISESSKLLTVVSSLFLWMKYSLGLSQLAVVGFTCLCFHPI